MSQVKQAAAAPMNLSERTVRLAGETSDWVATNSVDILIASAAALVIALILLGLRSFGQRILSDDRPDGKWRGIFARVLSKTTLFFITAASVALVAEHAETPSNLLRLIEILFIVAASVQAAIWARELILGLIEHRVGVADEHSTLGSAIGIIRLLVTVGLFAIAIILILSNLGVNVTGLVAGLGIGGIAIGLAAQGIFSDLFAALAIIFDRPFRRGDTIRYDTTTGTVEHIGLKTTRLRSLDGQQVVMSNTNLLNKEINNFALLERRGFQLVLGVVYQTPLQTLRAIPALVESIVARHEKAALVRCGMRGFGPSSLDFEVQFEVQGADYEYAFATRAAICLEILEAFGEAGIQLAYPTQTTFTAAPDGTLVMPYATQINSETDGSGAETRQE